MSTLRRDRGADQAERLLAAFERHCRAAAKAARLFRKQHPEGCACPFCADRGRGQVAGIRRDLAGAAWQLGQLAACTESDHDADEPAVVVADEKVGPMLATMFRLTAALNEVLTLVEQAEELTDKHHCLAAELRDAGMRQVSDDAFTQADVMGLLSDLRGVAYVARVGRDTVEGILPGWVDPPEGR